MPKSKNYLRKAQNKSINDLLYFIKTLIYRKEPTCNFFCFSFKYLAIR